MHQLSFMWTVLLMMMMMMTLNLAFGQFTEFSADYKDNNVIDYTFRYYVDDEKFGISMEHFEEKRDDRIIGRYALLEPGGYVRSVYYSVDGGSGFRSTVQTRMLGAPPSKHFIRTSSVPYQHHVPIAAI